MTIMNHAKDRVAVTILAAGLLAGVVATARGVDVLWYDQPAKDWRTEALPIGNGRIGAMMFGGIEQERIQFNEQTLWIGQGGWCEWPQVAPFGCYQNFGDVNIRFKTANASPAPAPADYRRELDIENGIHSVAFTQDGVRVTREAFASRPDQMLVFHYTANKPGTFSGELALKLAHKAEQNADGDRISSSGVLANGMKFACVLKVLHEGGTVQVKEGNLTFEKCDSLTLLLDARTNYKPDYHANWKGADPEPLLEKEMAAAAAKPYTDLRGAHLADFAPVMRRVSLELGKTASDILALPINKRLAAHAKGGADPALEALELQYGRYILLSSSRPGGLPANLQGLWNDSNTPNWFCDYHTDINVQMAYWAAENANLSECHLPLFDYLDAQAEPNRVLTRKRFGEKTRGWSPYITMNPFGGGACIIYNGATAWLAQHYFDHWDYTRDPVFLRTRTYPFLKEICQYWEDRLKVLPNASTGSTISPQAGSGQAGKLVSPDAWSPEHGSQHVDGPMCDQQVIWQLFEDYQIVARELGVDKEYRQTIAGLQSRLSINKIGRFGQLQEWQEDIDQNPEGHRHLMHLLSSYPGRQITLEDTPGLAKAAIISLNARVLMGDGAQSWTWPWRTALWARFKQPETAYGMLQKALSVNTAPNLLTWAKPPPTLQVDGICGYPAGLIEMLMQSHRRTVTGSPIIELLPALPKAWPSGNVSGLRARGGFAVDMVWKNGKLTCVTVCADRTAGTCNLQYGTQSQSVTLKKGRQTTWKP